MPLGTSNKNLKVLLNEIENEINGKSRTTKKSRKLERIDQLLKQANQKHDSGQLVQPEGSSAVEIYKNILVIDPGNKEALTGIDKISGALERYARARQANGDLVGGLSIVDIGLKYIPDSPGLLSVRTELKQEIAAKVR